MSRSSRLRAGIVGLITAVSLLGSHVAAAVGLGGAEVRAAAR